MSQSFSSTPHHLIEQILIIGIPPDQVISHQKDKYVPHVLYALPSQSDNCLQTEVNSNLYK